VKAKGGERGEEDAKVTRFKKRKKAAQKEKTAPLISKLEGK